MPVEGIRVSVDAWFKLKKRLLGRDEFIALSFHLSSLYFISLMRVQIVFICLKISNTYDNSWHRIVGR